MLTCVEVPHLGALLMCLTGKVHLCSVLSTMQWQSFVRRLYYKTLYLSHKATRLPDVAYSTRCMVQVVACALLQTQVSGLVPAARCTSRTAATQSGAWAASHV